MPTFFSPFIILTPQQQITKLRNAWRVLFQPANLSFFGYLGSFSPVSYLYCPNIMYYNHLVKAIHKYLSGWSHLIPNGNKVSLLDVTQSTVCKQPKLHLTPLVSFYTCPSQTLHKRATVYSLLSSTHRTRLSPLNHHDISIPRLAVAAIGSMLWSNFCEFFASTGCVQCSQSQYVWRPKRPLVELIHQKDRGNCMDDSFISQICIQTLTIPLELHFLLLVIERSPRRRKTSPSILERLIRGSFFPTFY